MSQAVQDLIPTSRSSRPSWRCTRQPYPTPHDIVKAGKLEFKKAMVPQLRGRQLGYYLDEELKLDDSEATLSGDFSAKLESMELTGEMEMKRAGGV